MSLNDTLQSLRHRIPYQQAKDYLSSHDIAGGVGWDATIASISAMKPPLNLTVVHELEQLLLNSLVVARKSIEIYELPAGDMSTLRKLVSAAPAPTNAFAKAFPHTVSNLSAKGLPPDSTWLPVSVANYSNGTALILAAIRSYEVRAPIDYSAMPKAARDVLDDYVEVIGLSKVRSQVFDTLWIPNSGNRLASLVDQPEGVGKSFAGFGHAAVRKYVQNEFSQKLVPIDLFNAVNGIYFTAGDGAVVELGFATDASGVKNSKMRKGNACVRTDLFQVGGEKAIRKPVTPYKMAVRWKFKKSAKFTCEPELILDGKARMLSKSSARLFEASALKLWDTKDLEFVLGKLNKHT